MGSSSSDSGMWSVVILASRVGTAEVGGEVLGIELDVDATSDGCIRVSGYSSSKRWIIPSKV